MSLRMILAASVLGMAGPVVAADVAETVQLKESTAIAYGPGGIPLFRAERDFILSYAGSPDGRIVETNKVNGRVRISADGQSEVWLSCDELATEIASCVGAGVSRPAAAAAPSSRRKVRGGGVPNCPGDVRCPRIGSK